MSECVYMCDFQNAIYHHRPQSSTSMIGTLIAMGVVDIIQPITFYAGIAVVYLILFWFVVIVHALFPLFELYHVCWGDGISRSSTRSTLAEAQSKALDEICDENEMQHEVLHKTVSVSFDSGNRRMDCDLHDVRFYRTEQHEGELTPDGSESNEIDESLSDLTIAKEGIGLNNVKRGAILLVHGAMCGPTYFRPNIKPLIDDGWDVHCMSLPGFGPGGGNNEALTLLDRDELLDFYTEFIALYVKIVFQDQKPVIYSHSFGSFLCTQFSHKYPDLVSCSIISNAIGIFPSLGTLGSYWGWMFYLGFPNRTLRRYGYVMNSFILMFGSPKYYGYVMYYDLLQMTCDANIGDIIITKYINPGFNKLSWSTPLFFNLINTKTPTIELYSTDDTIIPLYQAMMVNEIAKTINIDIPLYTVRNCWHHPIRSDEFNAVLKRCLDKIPVPLTNRKSIGKKQESQIYGVFSDYGYATVSRHRSRELITSFVKCVLGVLGADGGVIENMDLTV